MMSDLLAHLCLISLSAAEELQGRDQPFLARNGDNPGLLRTGGDYDEVEFFLECDDIGCFQALAQVHGRHRFPDACELGIDNLVGNARLRNQSGNLAAQFRVHIVENSLMPLQAQLPGNGNTGRACADDGNSLSGQRRQLRKLSLDAGLPELRYIHGEHPRALPGAALHAEVGAKIAADCSRKGGVSECEVHGFVHAAFAYQPPPLVYGNSGRTAHFAWSGELLVFPDRNPTAQEARGYQRDLAPVEIDQVADKPATSEFRVPNIGVKGRHRTPWPGKFFLRAASLDQLPFLTVGQMREYLYFSDCGEVLGEIFGEPRPVIIGDGYLPGIRVAEALVGTSAIDPSAHHAHAGTIPKNIFRVLRVVAADDGNAAGHELGKVIARRPEDPQFRRGEAGIALGHGHAAGADIARNVDLALRHGVGRAIGGVAVDDDFSPAVEPADIIRGGTQNLDERIGEAHGSDALAG